MRIRRLYNAWQMADAWVVGFVMGVLLTAGGATFIILLMD